MEIKISDLHLVAGCLRKSAVAATVPSGLDPPLVASEIAVLGYLLRHRDGARISDITRGTMLAQSRVSTVVTRLKQRGWITTRVPPEDTRATIVTLRPKVIDGTQRELHRDGTAVINQLLVGVSASERAVVVRGLCVLIRALRNAEPSTTGAVEGEESQ
jgi:DNA-binding MarR family transcriptional regulator